MTAIQTDTADIQGRLQRLEAMTRSLEQGRLPILSGADFTPVEGEQDLQQADWEAVLDGAQPLSMRLYDVKADARPDGTKILIALMELRDFQNRQFAGAGLKELLTVDGQFASTWDGAESRFVVTAGDTITILGDHQFEVTRVLTKEPMAWRDVIDPTTTAYIVKKP